MQKGDAPLQDIENIERIIGRPVISLETANKLGKVTDLLADPLSGQLAGLCVRREDGSYALASILDMHEIGPDAVMVESDTSLVLAEASPLNTLPKAKKNLTGVKVVTEHGQVLGAISNLYLCFAKRPIFIYEVRASLIDKLLGRASYVPASLSCAFSQDRSSLVVTGVSDDLDTTVASAAERILGPYHIQPEQAAVFDIHVRTHSS